MSQRFRHEALGVVFQVRAGRLHALLWRRAEPPHQGSWALPGGLLDAGERLGTSASRHLAAKVDIPEISHLEQLETRSDPARDPRERVLATAYLALVPPGARPRLPSDTTWHLVDALPDCAFDHASIISSARERLRAKLSYTNIGFALAPETFTISQLRDTYSAALGHPVSATNLQRILTRRGVIQATPGVSRPAPGGGRPAALYRFAARELVVTNPFAAFRPRVVEALPRHRGVGALPGRRGVTAGPRGRNDGDDDPLETAVPPPAMGFGVDGLTAASQSAASASVSCRASVNSGCICG
ncbi:MAG: NUDIX hydrolase [Nocardiopsaceae bacterium]|nr:NUDIX hydrolase [Nocardiopsaceae bacterium]